MVGSSQDILSQASKEVQAADHIFNTVYGMTEEPRVLLRSMVHCCRAVNLACEALEEEPPEEVGKAVDRFRLVLEEYRRAPTAFLRRDSLVIASEEWDMRKLSPEFVNGGLSQVKAFVYEAGKRIILGCNP